MGAIDIRRWFELLERRLFCSATSDALAGPPLTIDPPAPNLIIPTPLSGTQVVASSTTTIQYLGALPGGNGPMAIAADGTVWAANGAQLIRITPDGNSTMFQDPNGDSIYGITIGGDGNVWLTENGTSTSAGQAIGDIARVDANGNFTDFTIPPDGTGSNQVGPTAYVPISIVTSADGDVYFNLSDDVTDNKLIRVAPDGTMTFFNLPDGSQRGALTATSDGAIWFTGTEGMGSPDYVGRFNPGDGSMQQFVFPLQTPFDIPGPPVPVQPGIIALTPGANGSVWFATEFGGAIGNITPQGNVTEYQTGLAGQFGITQQQMNITMAPDGSIWITCGGLINMNLQDGTPIFTTVPNVGAGAIATASNGQVYFNSGNAIDEITPSTAPVSVPPPPVTPPSDPVTPPPDGGIITPPWGIGPILPVGPAPASGDASAAPSESIAAVVSRPAFASVFSHAPVIASHVDLDPVSVLSADPNSLQN